MSRPATSGFQKRLKSPTRRTVGLARVKVMHTPEGSGAECSCEYTTYHRRAKVVDRRIEAHVNDKHQGRALWL